MKRMNHVRAQRRTFVILFASLFMGLAFAGEPEAPFQTDVFLGGRDGYHTFRIPALIVTPAGSLLAFCEGRKTGRGDYGDLDLVLCRSSDGGRTWGPLELVYEEGGTAKITIGNPCPVVDRSTGGIWLPFCRDNDDVLVTYSDDEGKTWAKPREITADVKKPGWGWYATGPGVGIQLTRGPHANRLVIPCDHREEIDGKATVFSHVFYSDDGGATWHLGESVERHTNECQVVECADGSLVINMRNHWGRTGGVAERAGMRAVARSHDGGATWSDLRFDASLIDPVCQASFLRYTGLAPGEKNRVLFSNPASKTNRHRMTVRLSYDEGENWPVSRLIYEGSAAYSCLTVLPDREIGLLYERDDYKKISFTRFSLAWLTEEEAQRDSPKWEIWAVDPLEKVFRDAEPSNTRVARAEVARGEVATLQFVVRCSEPIRGLNVRARPLPFLFPVEGEPPPSALRPLSPRFVSCIPVDRPIQRPPKDQLRKPPGDFPDPLLEVEKIDVPANTSQPIWITVPVPADATPGSYGGSSISIRGRFVGSNAPYGFVSRTGATISVRPVTVGPSRLWVTNWFTMQARHMEIDLKPSTDEYWALLRRYARNMAAHRQNVVLISPLSHAEFRAGPEGRLEIAFSRFDRWVEIFMEEGVIGRIEGGHIGGRKSGWNSPFVVRIRRIVEGKVQNAAVDPASPEADRFYAQFFPALVGHLKAKEWLDIYMQHLGDEPTKSNAESYRAMARLARKYAPELRIVEACHTKDLAGSIDIWVPQLNYLHNDLDHYLARQKAGEEVWFYTCVFPQGEYANRFIEQPLLKARLLHWINFRYGITGYLHWGYNHWTKDSPYTHTTRPHGGPPYLPAGDPWIVYPGRDGPLDSIRHEAMRDGIADYELLSMLAERDPEAAKRLAAQHVLAFDRYDCDIETFRATRRKLLELLSRP